jgi:predicted  nucleic acid-binding Zn-ribbon protein
MTTDPLSVHPEVEALKAGNALLRDEAVRLLTEQDHLLHTVRPNLLALYQVKLGPWELRLLKEQCDTARLRRLIEMVQAFLNVGRLPVMAEIGQKLDAEFILWQARLREAAEKLQDAEQQLQHLMSLDDDREFRKLYRSLVKRLHPDVVPDQNEQIRLLWQRVQAAYGHSDLAEMRALWELTQQLAPVVTPSTSMDALKTERETLRRQAERLARQIAELRQRPPFSLQAKLEDDAWVAARRAEIETQIVAQQEQRRVLESHLRTLTPEMIDGKWLSAN